MATAGDILDFEVHLYICVGLDVAYLDHQGSWHWQSQVAFGRAPSVGTRVVDGLADGVDASESS